MAAEINLIVRAWHVSLNISTTGTHSL